MKSNICIAAVFGLTLVLSSVAAEAPIQSPSERQPFEPTVGQPGKDVIWVPTNQPLVDKMLDLAKVTPDDFLLDLGSGDGRTVIAAAKRGAHALGIEYNPDMVALSRSNAAKEGVADRAQFKQADLFETDLSKATVITMFLLEHINLKLRPKILDLKPGTRIVSNTFGMGDWERDETVTAEDVVSREGDYYTSYRTALLWIVPAKVAGTWQMADGELVLSQKYQVINGTLTGGGQTRQITNCRLRGGQIHFTAGDSEYAGAVNNDRILGVRKRGTATVPWNAVLRPGAQR